jgi:hypothetical protein
MIVAIFVSLAMKELAKKIINSSLGLYLSHFHSNLSMHLLWMSKDFFVAESFLMALLNIASLSFTDLLLEQCSIINSKRHEQVLHFSSH